MSGPEEGAPEGEEPAPDAPASSEGPAPAAPAGGEAEPEATSTNDAPAQPAPEPGPAEEGSAGAAPDAPAPSPAKPAKPGKAPLPPLPPLGPLPLLETSLGAVVAGLVDVVGANLFDPFPSVGGRALHALWDVGMLVCLALLLDVVAFALRRTIKVRAVELLVATLLHTALGYWILERVFTRQADAALNGDYAPALFWAFVAGTGVLVTLLGLAARWLATRRRALWALLPLLLGVGGLIGNLYFFPDDYIEVHTEVVWCASLVVGAAVGRRFDAWRAASPARVRGVQIALAASVLLGLFAPPNAVRLTLFRSPGGIGAWVLANTWWSLPDLEGEPDPSVDPRWLSARIEGERAPSAERLVTKGSPVVVMITIDATRADAVLDPKNAKRFPNFKRLMEEGTTFTHARSPGSQTAVSLTATFAGKYFSEMMWSKHGSGATRFDYAADDTTPRLPALLGAHGVSTSKVAALTFLFNDFGVAPGFAEDEHVTDGRKHAKASYVIEPLIKRLRRNKPKEPLFMFAHMTEPHAPYDRGKAKSNAPPFERYLSEIEVADEWLGKVMNALESGNLAGRSILIVSSDHGEAFGEHGTTEHTKTIYEELLRVPLLVWGSGVKARRVDTPVTLLDVSPTVLDIFGAPTPDWMAGESLVPILAGSDAPLTRPILAEGRLRRALFLGDLKVIVDLRRKLIEAYDLAKDPDELVNLYDTDPERVRPALLTLAAYFRERGYTKDGYKPIYKP